MFQWFSKTRGTDTWNKTMNFSMQRYFVRTRIFLECPWQNKLLFAVLAASLLSQTALAEGDTWRDLLTPKEFTNWVEEQHDFYRARHPDSSTWELDNGVLRCSGETGNAGLLRYRPVLRNFELRLEYRLAKGCNSGVGLRAPQPYSGNPETLPSQIGYEVQIVDDAGEPPSETGTGAFYGVLPPLASSALPAGKWNRMHIICEGPRIHVELNDRTVQDIDQRSIPKLDSRSRAGYISVQNHGGDIEFRRMSLREIPLARPGAKVVFLGDSITAHGGYINDLETYLALYHADDLPTLINLGLSSETVSGLSEADHPFPRPCVHDRLDDVLSATKPEIVVACYGMNCGIYHPLSEERFAAYRDGVERLVEKVQATGARVVLLTPPPFAGSRLKESHASSDTQFGFRTPYRDYDEVLGHYAKWLLTLNDREGVDVLDVRPLLHAHMDEAYGQDPIHPNARGHRWLARGLLPYWLEHFVKIDSANASTEDRWAAISSKGAKVAELVAQRRTVFDRTLLWKIGHTRPGNPPEISWEEARRRAEELDREIREAVRSAGFPMAYREHLPGLENLFQIAGDMFSGSQPQGDTSFASLKDLGIQTIVSVDGATPNVAAAREHGLRYVHIPIGYSGISAEAQGSLARLMREATPPFYIHCHHGKHRGPAMAALAGMLAGSLDRHAAMQVLECAGTSPQYPGLWRAVEDFSSPPAEVAWPELMEIARVSSFVAAMAEIDEAFDGLGQILQADGAASTAHPDLTAPQAALLLKEGFVEARRHAPPDETAWHPLLDDSLQRTKTLEIHVQQRNWEPARMQWERLRQSCRECHAAHRDVP